VYNPFSGRSVVKKNFQISALALLAGLRCATFFFSVEGNDNIKGKVVKVTVVCFDDISEGKL